MKNLRKAIVFALAAGQLVFGAGCSSPSSDDPAIPEEPEFIRSFYVSSSGNDVNNGTSQTSPWQTIDRVNLGPNGLGDEYQPGDAILFKSGETWTWEDWMDDGTLKAFLAPQGSGTAEEPITIGRYGGAVKPHIEGKGLVDNIIRLHNQQHWVIRDLEITNLTDGWTNPGAYDDTQGGLLGDFRGIFISGNNGQTLSGFTMRNLYIHDVCGEIRWIGQAYINNPQPILSRPGIWHQAGWDGSKRTGAIFVEGQNGTAPTIFKDVIVENNRLERNSFAAFTIKQWNGSAQQRWAIRSDSPTGPDYVCTQWKPHENIVVRGNYINQEGIYKGDGIYITTTRYALVEKNVIKHAGVCGIETYYADHIVTQFNDISYTVSKAGGDDSNAIDPDRNVTHQIIQYNYVHHNGDAIMMCGYTYNTVILRYNVLYNNTRYWLRNAGVARGLTQIYNNVLYNDVAQTMNPGQISFFRGGTGSGRNMRWELYNNVFYNGHSGTTVHSWNTGSPHVYSSNLYYGVTAPSDDAAAVSADPGFVGTPNFPDGTVEARWDNFDVFRPATDSPMIDGGALGTDGALYPPGSTYMKTSTQIIDAIKERIPDANIPDNMDYALLPLDPTSRADIGLFSVQ